MRGDEDVVEGWATRTDTDLALFLSLIAADLTYIRVLLRTLSRTDTCPLPIWASNVLFAVKGRFVVYSSPLFIRSLPATQQYPLRSTGCT